MPDFFWIRTLFLQHYLDSGPSKGARKRKVSCKFKWGETGHDGQGLQGVRRRGAGLVIGPSAGRREGRIQALIKRHYLGAKNQKAGLAASHRSVSGRQSSQYRLTSITGDRLTSITGYRLTSNTGYRLTLNTGDRLKSNTGYRLTSNTGDIFTVKKRR